ncbi:MAG: hypothetical protein Q9182_007102 [Xanthomendoza sp. 2 TL-2023]
MLRPKIVSPRLSQPTKYFRIPRRKKRGISMVPQHLIKVLASTPVGVALADHSVDQLAPAAFRALGEALGVALARISTSRIFLVLSPVAVAEAEALEVLVGENIEVQTNISFMDAAKGTSKDIYIHPLLQCKTCSGRGMKKGQSRSTCQNCGGTGTKVHFVQAGFQMASTCETCGGQGMVVPRGAECNTCNGNGAIRERKTVNVDIPGGVEDGMRLRVSGEGDAAPTGTAANPNARSTRGDLYVFIRVASDSKFGRSGADVLYTASIPLTTAVLGGEVTIPTLDSDVKLKVHTGTGSGDRVTLSGMGMPKIGGKRNTAGDLRVEFRVAMPKHLSANQRTILEMLADELGDKSAKRIMNIGSTSTSSSSPKPEARPADSHKNEGFLKSAWHKLTHHHDDALSRPSPPIAEAERKGDDDEPKKAAGSG